MLSDHAIRDFIREVLILESTAPERSLSSTWRISESKIHGVGIHANCLIPKNTKISKVLLNNSGFFLLTEFGKHVNHQKKSNP